MPCIINSAVRRLMTVYYLPASGVSVSVCGSPTRWPLTLKPSTTSSIKLSFVSRRTWADPDLDTWTWTMRVSFVMYSMELIYCAETAAGQPIAHLLVMSVTVAYRLYIYIYIYICQCSRVYNCLLGDGRMFLALHQTTRLPVFVFNFSIEHFASFNSFSSVDRFTPEWLVI